jgi:hypothetical protein
MKMRKAISEVCTVTNAGIWNNIPAQIPWKYA